MGFSELEQHRYESQLKRFCEQEGPPPHLHEKVKWGYKVDSQNQSVELFEIRPLFMDPTIKVEHGFVKAKYVRTREYWKVYWLRGTGKWVSYKPCPVVGTLEELLKLVARDECGCFLG